MTEYKTDMSITKIDKYKKTEHDGFVIFCDFFTLVCVFFTLVCDFLWLFFTS